MPHQDEALTPDDIDELFSQAIEEEWERREKIEQRRAHRRIAVGFLLMMATGAICWIVLPRFGLVLPWAMVVGIFALMALAGLAPAIEKRQVARLSEPSACSLRRSKDLCHRTGDCGHAC